MDKQSTNITGLAYYIKEELYKQWKADRKKIEQKWQRNLDAFKCISTGTWKAKEGEDWRSNTFIPLTKIKVLAAWSIVVDMFLQGGKLPFSLQPSAMSEAVDLERADINIRMAADQKNADQKNEEMTALIQEQLQSCKSDQQFMKCIMSSAVYGEMVAKRFVATIKKRRYQQEDYAVDAGLMGGNQEDYTRFTMVVEEKDQPAWRYCSVWDIFRDIEEDDLKESTGIIERQMFSPYQLRQFKGQPLYLDDAIETAISAAPAKGGTEHSGESSDNMAPRFRDIKHRTRNIEGLEFWGRAPRKIVEAFEKEKGIQQAVQDGVAGEEPQANSFDSVRDYENDGDEVEIMGVMAGDEVIRYARTEPSGDDRPYYRAVWEMALDESHGCGVADNLESTQTVLNGMVRTFEDNKKLSANVMLAIKKRFMAKSDGSLYPGKEIEIADECDDVRKAMQQVIIQDVGATILDGIGLFERYADEASQLPKIMQGETAEKKKPDTLGELNMLQQNAGKYLGGVIKNHDEGLLEPLITDFYRYNMEDPDNQIGKGDFTVQALGFTSFQNRVTRLEKIMQFLNLVMSDQVGELRAMAKIKELIREVAKALDLDPDDVVKTDEELSADQQQAMMEQQQAQQEAMAAEEEAKSREDEIQERQMVVNEEKHRQDLEKEKNKFGQALFLEAVKNKAARLKQEPQEAEAGEARKVS